MLAAALVLASLCAGCSKGNWVIRSQAEPNPLLGQKTFVVEVVEFRELSIEKKDQEVIRAAYNYELRREGQDRYSYVLPEDAKPEDVRIRTSFLHVDSSESEVEVLVQLVKDGVVVDEFTLSAEASFSIFDSTSRGNVSLGYASERQRLDNCGEELGENVTQYIDSRTE